MITQKAYKGKELIYRAYFNGQVIWDHGVYGYGSLIAALTGHAMPMVETPAPVQMHAEGELNGMGAPITREVTHVQLHTEGNLVGDATPNTAEAVHAAGCATGVLQVLGAASTFGLVFARGQMDAKLVGNATPNTAEVIPTAGRAVGKLSGHAMPTQQEVANILAAASGEITGYAMPKSREPDRVIACVSGKLTGVGLAKVLPVHTVTFMNGDTVLHQERVIDGNSCTDPVAAGVIDTPTKEMTAQYTYEHAGWSLTDGGEADAEALANITGDTVVYAAFNESIRYYTVLFYDGGTFVESVSVPYGGTAETSYVKKGYKITGYEPSNENITCDTICYVQFDQITFGNATWAEISEISESGNAQDYFSVGDTKKITMNGVSLNAKIIGFNHDDKADGSGKAGITIELGVAKVLTCYSNTDNCWPDTDLFAAEAAALDAINDADLRAVIKKVKKPYNYAGQTGIYGYKNVDLWPLSLAEMGYTAYTDGTVYEAFAATGSKTVGTSYKYSDIKKGTHYWTRTWKNSTYIFYIHSNGYAYHNTSSSTTRAFIACCCV